MKKMPLDQCSSTIPREGMEEEPCAEFSCEEVMEDLEEASIGMNNPEEMMLLMSSSS